MTRTPAEAIRWRYACLALCDLLELAITGEVAPGGMRGIGEREVGRSPGVPTTGQTTTGRGRVEIHDAWFNLIFALAAYFCSRQILRLTTLRHDWLTTQTREMELSRARNPNNPELAAIYREIDAECGIVDEEIRTESFAPDPDRHTGYMRDTAGALILYDGPNLSYCVGTARQIPEGKD